MYGGLNFCFTNDRFNRPLSAISLQNGYLNIPPSDFFGTGKFSILAWVKVRNYKSWSRIVDFGLANKGLRDNIVFALTYYASGRPRLGIRNDGTQILGLTSTLMPSKELWEYFACTFDYPNAHIYLNGTIVASGKSSSPMTTRIRDSNYLGRGWNYYELDDTDADFDDLKIFNRALSQQEILDEMNN